MQPKGPFISTVLLSVIFGLAAGGVGMLLVLAYALPLPSFSGAVAPVLRDRTDGTAAERQVLAMDDAFRSAVGIFEEKPAGSVLWRNSYLPAEAVGAGTVLTSDGWIISHSSVLPPKSKKALVAVVGGEPYVVERTVRDPYSDVIFMKVGVSNLPVTPFGGSEGLRTGDQVYSYDVAGGLRRLYVSAFGHRPPRSADELVGSSERIGAVMRLSTDAAVPSGAMVLNPEGEVVGVYAKDDGFGGIVVPFEAFSEVIGSVLRDNDPQRPRLGVMYVDLARLTAAPGLSRRGALLASADGKTPAVAPRSPAQDARLRSGDVITAVDGEDVTANKGLSDLLAEYAPGSTVTLTVTRGKAEFSVDTVLEETPAP